MALENSYFSPIKLVSKFIFDFLSKIDKEQDRFQKSQEHFELHARTQKNLCEVKVNNLTLQDQGKLKAQEFFLFYPILFTLVDFF